MAWTYSICEYQNQKNHFNQLLVTHREPEADEHAIPKGVVQCNVPADIRSVDFLMVFLVFLGSESKGSPLRNTRSTLRKSTLRISAGTMIIVVLVHLHDR